MEKITINGIDYTIHDILGKGLSSNLTLKVKDAIRENQVDWVKLFQFLKETKKTQKKLGNVAYQFFGLYAESIKAYTSIDVLIEAAKKTVYIDFFKTMLADTVLFVGEEEWEKCQEKLISIIKEIGTLSDIENLIDVTAHNLSQENMDSLFEKIADSNSMESIIGTITSYSVVGFNLGKLIEAFDGLIDEMIEGKKTGKILTFVRDHLEIIDECGNDKLANSINKIINYIILQGDAANIFILALSAYNTSYFEKILEALIDTNNLRYLLQIWMMIFDENNHLVKEKKKMIGYIIDAVIKTNIPAYIYIFMVRAKWSLSEDDIKRIFDKMIELDDKKYIEYLIIELKPLGLSENLKKIIQQSYPNSALNMTFDNYKLFNQLENAFISNDVELLYELGVVVHEDGSFDTEEESKLANIQAGL